MMAFFGANAKKVIKSLSFLGTPGVVPAVCLIYVEAGTGLASAETAPGFANTWPENRRGRQERRRR
jgi:hypothetical protein